MRWPSACLLAALTAAAPATFAEGRLEIITLRHRPAAQIVPTLRPLVEPGGALSTLDDKILLRVSPANLAELRAAIDALDTPLRRLVVSVRQDRSSEGQGGGVGLSGRLEPGHSRLRLEGGAGQYRQAEGVSQQVQVVEGGQALIRVGQSLPVAMREWRPGPGGWQPVDSMRYTDVGSGFLASPQLIGERVNIEIAPDMERVGASGIIETSRLATSVSGRLGEWIPLGGTQAEASRGSQGTAGIGRDSRSSQAAVWLRVDLVE